MGLTGCPETSVRYYHPSLRNIPAQRNLMYNFAHLLEGFKSFASTQTVHATVNLYKCIWEKLDLNRTRDTPIVTCLCIFLPSLQERARRLVKFNNVTPQSHYHPTQRRLKLRPLRKISYKNISLCSVMQFD